MAGDDGTEVAPNLLESNDAYFICEGWTVDLTVAHRAIDRSWH